MAHDGDAMRFDSNLLRQTRLDLGLTQEQAAGALGVDVRTYRRYESGQVNAKGFSVRDPRRRKLLARMSAELGIAEEELVVEAGGAPVEAARPDGSARADDIWRPRFVHTLQRAQHFVARPELMAELDSWLGDSAPGPVPGPVPGSEPGPASGDAGETRVLALVGMGGMGKTALVEHAIRTLARRERNGGLFVWSFFDNPRTEELLAQALDYFAINDGDRDGDRAPGVEPGRSPPPTLERLHRVLADGRPHILVLDGLEIVQSPGHGARAYGELEDPIMRRLLSAVARGLGATRALLTSRFALADLGAWEGSGLRTLPIGEMERARAIEVLRTWGVRGDECALASAIDRIGRHALSLAVTGSYVGGLLGGEPERLAELSLDEAARDDPLARRLTRVLDAYAGSLSGGARDLLAALAAFAEGVDVATLAVVARAGTDVAGNLADMDGPAIRRELARLRRLGLVYLADSGLYSTHPFVRQYFQRVTERGPALRQAGYRNDSVASADGVPVTDLRGRPERPSTDGELMDHYEDLVREMLRADRPYEAYLLYSRSLGGFAHLGLTAGDMMRGARVVRAFAEDGDPARMPTDLPTHLRAALAYDLGLYSCALGDIPFARRCYEAYNRWTRAAKRTDMLATGLRTLAYTERLAGCLKQARRCIDESLVVVAALVAEGAAHACGDQIRGLALAAAIAHELGDIDQARALFDQSRGLDRRPVARRALWHARHLVDVGLVERARVDTLANLDVCRQLNWHGHVAHCQTLLGRAALVADDVARARIHHRAAMDWVRTTGEVEMVLRCRVLQAGTALIEGRAQEAGSAAVLGLHVARACGVGMFAGALANLGARAALVGSRTERALELARSGLASESLWHRADAAHVAGLAERAAGRPARARAYLRQAVELRARIEHPGELESRRALAQLRGPAS